MDRSWRDVVGERTWERGASVALLLGGWLALMGPIFAGRSFWYRDQVFLNHPLRLYLRERLLRGELPLWNPHLSLGRPFLGFVFPAALHPLNALILLPAPFGVDLFNAVHVLVAATGAYAWLRALGRERPAATAGAATFAFGGPLLSMAAANGPYLWGIAFAPWALRVVAALGEEGDRADLARRTIALAMLLGVTVLAGDPMATWFTALAGLAQALSADAPSARRRALVGLALAGAVALALTAVQLLPALALAREIRGSGVAVSEAGRFSLRAARLIELVYDAPWGDPYGASWRVVRPQDGLDARPFVTTAYAGVAAVPLAVLGATADGRRGRVFGALAVLALALAMGRHTPVWHAWHALVPVDRLFRYPEKHLSLFALTLCPLVSAGLARCAAVDTRWIRGGAVAAVLVAAAGLAAPSLPEMPAAALRSGGILGAMVAVVALARARRWAPSRAVWAVALVAWVDLVSAGLGVMTWAPSWIYARPSRVVRAMRRAAPPGALARVIRPADLDVYGTPHTPVAYWDALAPNLGMQHGVAFVSSYETVIDEQMTAPLLAARRDPLRAWRALGLGFVLERTQTLAGFPRELQVGSLGRYGLTLLRIPSPAPRAFLAERVVGASNPFDAMTALVAPGFDPTRHAAIEGASSGSAQGRCDLVEDRVESITLRCASAGGGWAVLNDSYAAGWRAEVDGAERTIRRANGIARAVELPPGPRTLRFRYEPWGFRAGRWVSGLSLLACVAALAALRRRRVIAGP